MKIMIIDTWYQEFIASLFPLDHEDSYTDCLRAALDLSFGTSDFYSRNLRTLGWDVVDVIANHASLQSKWAREHDMKSPTLSNVLVAQIAEFKPDVVFLQDLSVPLPDLGDALVAGQCSCPMPSADKIARCDVIFTSFPHYISRIERHGVRAVYNPLAFDSDVLDRLKAHPFEVDRIY